MLTAGVDRADGGGSAGVGSLLEVDDEGAW